MDNKEMVYDYLLNELQVKEKLADILYTKITKYEDIYNNFLEWLNKRDFSELSPLVIEDYTPQQISESFPSFTGIGVFNIFVDLRDNKEKTIENIKKGFPRK